jgi:hypothetical protein
MNVTYTCLVTKCNKRVVILSWLTSAREKHEDSTSDDAVFICLRRVLCYLLIAKK